MLGANASFERRLPVCSFSQHCMSWIADRQNNIQFGEQWIQDLLCTVSVKLNDLETYLQLADLCKEKIGCRQSIQQAVDNRSNRLGDDLAQVWQELRGECPPFFLNPCRARHDSSDGQEIL